MKLENLKASIRRCDYRVDVDAVAEAIVSRLLAGGNGHRAVTPGIPLPPSGDVLEAG